MRKTLFASVILLRPPRFATSSCRKKRNPSALKTRVLPALDAEYLKTGGEGSNWAMPGFSSNEQSLSPLDKIDTSNVKDSWHSLVRRSARCARP